MEPTAVRDAFVQLWGSLGTFWGVSPTTARVFGWLLSRSEPADAVEIMEGLDLSRGAVSMACRELREWRLITTERMPGSRRTLYHPETDFEKVVRHVIQIRKQREWDPILESLQEWIPALEENPAPEAAVFAERLKAMEALVELADSIAERILRGGTVSNLGLKLLVGGGQRDRRREKPRALRPEEDREKDREKDADESHHIEGSRRGGGA
ncbi:MAG TPA: MarR family transcriptional regulator [Thermoanaerobaculia bacterium]|nr:MarR family transcriptional regulator [Thermoanaerobaculia bacterium]